MEEFYIGQIFNGIYPPKAAEWVNKNNAYIEEIPSVNGIRQFEIKVVPEPTEEEIKQQEIANIKAQLEEIDLKSIRAIRANDTEYIVKYETEAQTLRTRLSELV